MSRPHSHFRGLRPRAGETPASAGRAVPRVPCKRRSGVKSAQKPPRPTPNPGTAPGPLRAPPRGSAEAVPVSGRGPGVPPAARDGLEFRESGAWRGGERGQPQDRRRPAVGEPDGARPDRGDREGRGLPARPHRPRPGGAGPLRPLVRGGGLLGHRGRGRERLRAPGRAQPGSAPRHDREPPRLAADGREVRRGLRGARGASSSSAPSTTTATRRTPRSRWWRGPTRRGRGSRRR